ncbi:MAG: CapA family protein [Proteobacteria bacterium]|nr:CapA family protein [Pseudomonadota bacterium]
MRRLGWDHRDEYGWFMSAASVTLALAMVASLIAHVLVWRYQAKLADGEIAPRGAHAGGIAVLGASLGDVPDIESLAALRAELAARVTGIPWQRALIRRDTRAPLPIYSLFFPVNAASEALRFCRQLSSAAPGCTTSVASSAELSTPDHRPVDRLHLARLGVAPYTGKDLGPARVVYLPGRVVPAPPPKIVYLPPKPDAAPPQTAIIAPPPVIANAQAPLRLQPGVGSGEVHYPESLIWLSSTYRPGDKRLTDIVGAGDVMMGSIGAGLNPDIRPGVDVAALVGDQLAGIFRHADVAFVNLEGPLYEGPNGTGKSCAQCFAFHGPLYYAGVLRSLGVDVVSLANNHSGDYGEAGRNSTMGALRQNGIAFGGLDRDDARTATLVLPNGKKVGFIAFAPNNGTLNINDLGRAAALVRELKKSVDLVMVSFHGGGEGWTYVHVKRGSETYVGENRGDVTAFAHTVIDAGADIVIGQGPHVPRALEVYKGHLIAYSLGNFWTYAGVQTYAVSGMAPVLEAWVTPEGAIAGFTIHSARQAGLGVPHIDPLDEAARYMLYLTRSDFPGTYALVEGHRSLALTAPGGGGS